MEIFGLSEVEFDTHRPALWGQLVLYPHDQARFHPGHYLIEVVTVDLYEFAVSHSRQRVCRISCEFAHDSHDEGQFLHLSGPPDFDIVGDVNARRTNAA